MEELTSFWIVFLIMNVLLLILLILPEIMRFRNLQQELKMLKKMRRELGNNPSKEKFKEFIDLNKNKIGIISRVFFKMELMDKTKALLDNINDLVKKMKDDLDE